MPEHLVLHETHARAFFCAKHYGARPPFFEWEFIERLHYRPYVVSLPRASPPSEGLKFFLKRGIPHNVVASSDGLYAVIIHHDEKVIEFFGGREHGPFPNAAFVAFTVAHQYRRARGRAFEFKGVGHACRDAETVSEASGRTFENFQGVLARMVGKRFSCFGVRG